MDTDEVPLEEAMPSTIGAPDVTVGEADGLSVTITVQTTPPPERMELDSVAEDCAEIPPPPSTGAPSTPLSPTGGKNGGPMPVNRTHRSQTMRSNTEAIAAAIQAQRRQGMGETVSNALLTAQSLVQCGEDDRREETLRAKLQTLLYGPNGGPNMSAERKSRAVLDSIEDITPQTDSSAIRHPLEDFFSSGRNPAAAITYGGPDGGVHRGPSGSSSPRAPSPAPKKGRSRGLTQYQPYRQEERKGGPTSPRGAKDGRGGSYDLGDEATMPIPTIRVDAEGGEGDSSENTSRAPSELHDLGQRLRTYTPRRMVFPMVEKSKALIRQLRHHDTHALGGDGAPPSPRGRRGGVEDYVPPPPHRCKHTQRSPHRTRMLPTDSVFSPLALPETATDAYAGLAPLAGRHPGCGVFGSSPFSGSRRGMACNKGYTVHQHDYYVASAGDSVTCFVGVGNATLGPGASHAASSPLHRVLGGMSRETGQQALAAAQAKALVAMVSSVAEPLEGPCGGPMSMVTPSFDDYFTLATVCDDGSPSVAPDQRPPEGGLVFTADGAPASSTLASVAVVSAIARSQHRACGPLSVGADHSKVSLEGSEHTWLRRSSSPSFVAANGVEVSPHASTAAGGHLSPAKRIRARYAHLFAPPGGADELATEC